MEVQICLPFIKNSSLKLVQKNIMEIDCYRFDSTLHTVTQPSLFSNIYSEDVAFSCNVYEK